MDGKAIMVIVDQFDFASYTLRQLYHATDGVEKQITLPNCNLNIFPHKGLYIVAAILRRLGQSDDEITTTLSLAFKKQPIMIGTYAATSMILRREYDNPYINFSFGEKDDGYLVYYQVNVVNPDGMALIERRLNGVWNNNEKYVKPEEEIQYILKYVNN